MKLKGDKGNLDESMLCLVLNSDEWQGTQSFFEKLLAYCFEDGDIRRRKIEQYKRFWSLRSVLWIQRKLGSPPVFKQMWIQPKYRSTKQQ